VGRLDVLVAEALNLVLPTLLIETDLSRNHNLSRTLTRRIKRQLKEAKRVVHRASAVIELAKRHLTSGHDGDDRLLALLAFARDSDLIAGSPHKIDAPLILFIQG
jgi:hypothetical protein